MKHYNGSNPNGPGVDALPHYEVQERERVELLRANTERAESQPELNDQTRCVWPECPLRRMNSDALEWDRLRRAGTLDSGVLCRRHLTEAMQVAYELGMEPRDESGEFVRYATKPRLMRRCNTGFIYYIRVGGAIKIGFASDLRARLAQYPPNVVFLLAHAGTRDDEQDIHGKLLASRSHRKEWYRITDEVRDFIQDQLVKHGSLDDPRPKPKTGFTVGRINGAFKI